jgi:hypothetical protein
VLIYSHTTSPRLQYVAGFLSSYFQCPVQITTDKEAFSGANEIKICFSATNVCEHAIQITPSDLLFQNTLNAITPSVFQHVKGYPAFFATQGILGFDLFGAIFYLLSRYEEYLPHHKDIYGRYAHQNSLAFQHQFLHLPLINIWLEDLRTILQYRFPNKILIANSFEWLPTYDIDIAWSYKNKGLVRNAGGLVRSMVYGLWSMVHERLNVLRGKKQDPYDSYTWLDALHQSYSLKPLYFFHVGQKRNAYDKNIPTSNAEFQELVRHHANQYKIGLHPSWHSGNAPEVLQKEKKVLETICSQSITVSRQHYIRFTLPHTFRQLLEAGIKQDYSMGYGSINGFRASVASSFYWYDLEKETTTDLLLHPFCFMDANSFFEQAQTPEQALQEIQEYFSEVKKVNGRMITIWHNTFLGSDAMFVGWREAYTHFIRQIVTS